MLERASITKLPCPLSGYVRTTSYQSPLVLKAAGDCAQASTSLTPVIPRQRRGDLHVQHGIGPVEAHFQVVVAVLGVSFSQVLVPRPSTC